MAGRREQRGESAGSRPSGASPQEYDADGRPDARDDDSRLPAPVRWFVRFLEEMERRYFKGRPL